MYRSFFVSHCIQTDKRIKCDSYSYRNTSKRLRECQRIVVRLVPTLATKISKASGVPRFENWGVSELC